jgi:hypothetical protein
MQKWIYAGVNIGTNGSVTAGPYEGATFWQAVSALGAEGWELVLCFPVANGTQEFIFKRGA